MGYDSKLIRGGVSWAALGVVLAFALPSTAHAAVAAQVIEVKKIWNEGRHNAFTDLIQWHDRWWCTFRESAAHVGGDGAIRVLVSSDGARWASAARLTEPGIDLRDPKFSVTPTGQLMLNCGGSVYEGTTLKGKQSRVMFSSDGRTWTAPRRILHEGEWCWRVTWHDGVAYAAVYRSTTAATGEWALAVYRSIDGVNYEMLQPLNVTGRPNETTLRFTRDGEMIAMVRREAGDTLGSIGRAAPPYAQWRWQPSNRRLGGPNFIQLPNGTWITVTREYPKAGTKGGAQTIVAVLEADARLTPIATLPSGGDTSYAGLVWYDDLLWVSYYSSHEGQTSIYLAKVQLQFR